MLLSREKIKTYVIFGLSCIVICLIVIIVYLPWHSEDLNSQTRHDDISDTKGVGDNRDINEVEFDESLDSLTNLFQNILLEDNEINELIEKYALENDGLDISFIDFIYDKGLSDGHFIDLISPIIVIGSVQKMGSDRVFYEVLKLNKEAQNLILPYVVKNWAISDPQSALTALLNMENDRFADELQFDLLSVWAKNNYDDLIKNIDSLPNNLQSFSRFVAFTTLATESPLEATEEVKQFSHSIFETEVARTLASSWARLDANSALDWAMNSDYLNRYSRQEAVVEILQTMASKDPRQAMNRAFELRTIDPWLGNIDLEVFEVVVQVDLDFAKQMLNRISHVSARIMLGREFVRNEEWDQVIGIMNSIEHEKGKQDYWEYTFQYWAMKSPNTLLDKVEKFAPKVSSYAALQLFNTKPSFGFLDAKQFTDLASLLTKEDQQVWHTMLTSPRNRYLSIIDSGYGFSKLTVWMK